MKAKGKRIKSGFFQRDVLEVCPDILGKILVRKLDDGTELRKMITEVEAYRGEEDLGCHASKGKTERNKIMYEEGGFVYVYLIYGMYWMLNFVTAVKGEPHALLIRGLEDIDGPGKVGKVLKLDKSFYGEDLETSKRLWVEGNPKIKCVKYETSPRIGIDYANEWARKPWRFIRQ